MRRLSLIAILLAGALLATGCNKSNSVTFADTEGITVDVGGLQYQVQISRYLNPNDTEDIPYLRGLPAGTKLDPGRNAVWFAVFMRVKNPSKQTLTPTTDFTITDTLNNKWTPVQQDPAVNPFVYVPTPLAHAAQIPKPDSAAFYGPTQGALILFHLNANDLQNRPLDLHIAAPGSPTATVELDL
jgi:hypothetical protein